MRILFAVLGIALMCSGGGGLLLLSRGRFPEPVRNLLLGEQPGRPGAPGPGAPVWVPIPIGDGPITIGPAIPAASVQTDVSARAADEEPAQEESAGAETAVDGEGAGLPAEAEVRPTATPRPPTVTPTPAPTARPVTLAGGQAVTRITAVKVPSIRLESEVVPARLVTWAGVTTWEVPPFNVGHGLFTAGAGDPGNAVLVGHVSSVSHGNVFKDLQRVRTGDLVQVLSDEQVFQYVVTEAGRVPRTDLAIYAATENATVTLVTCTGEWLQDLYDYSERFVVRAALIPPTPTPSPTATRTPLPTRTPSPTPTETPTPTATATRPPLVQVELPPLLGGGTPAATTASGAPAGPPAQASPSATSGAAPATPAAPAVTPTPLRSGALPATVTPRAAP